MALDHTIQGSVSAVATAPAVSATTSAPSSGGFSFRALLSDLNPLHFLQTSGTPAAAAAAAAASSSSASASASPSATSTAPSGGFSLRTLLSDLNPLQYIPVVGAVYRAVTGDEGNADLRFVASLGTSFALGGPVGVGITVAEKVTGIDPETIGRRLLSGLLHHAPKPAASPATPPADPSTALASAATPGATPAATTGTRTATTAGTTAALPPTAAATRLAADLSAGTSGARAWTPEELSAYGVKRTADNGLSAGGLSSADVLNTLELHRLSGRYA
jgi:hypothetical protein